MVRRRRALLSVSGLTRSVGTGAQDLEPWIFASPPGSPVFRRRRWPALGRRTRAAPPTGVVRLGGFTPTTPRVVDNIDASLLGAIRAAPTEAHRAPSVAEVLEDGHRTVMADVAASGYPYLRHPS
jgi:hypothetical protein